MAELRVAAASQEGLVRTRNEDAYVVGRHLWAVADGLGGQAAGAVASRIAARCLTAYDNLDEVDQLGIAALMGRVNEDILEYGAKHPRSAGLGTTVAGVAQLQLAGRDHWLVFNVGDSRVYRLADGCLTQETVDHSEVQRLVDEGSITPEEARTHPDRNVLTRCLGTAQVPSVEMRVVPAGPGDRLLVCTDGLTAELDDGTIASVLSMASGPDEAVGQLVAGALSNGGHDNVTVIVVEVSGGATRGSI
ncbi:MAG: protein phosphatase 2C domain-containing protein [Propionibacteriaceae bacterium]|nr:protein phosphatase 2C domain-containing protein [Propionibacteriaceae bacterium]